MRIRRRPVTLWVALVAALVAADAAAQTLPRELAPVVEQIDALVATEHGRDAIGSVTVGLVVDVGSTGTTAMRYGMGFEVRRRGQLVALGHSGITSGYRAGASFDRATKTGVVVLASVGGGRLVAHDLALRVLDTLAPARRATVPATTESGPSR